MDLTRRCAASCISGATEFVNDIRSFLPPAARIDELDCPRERNLPEPLREAQGLANRGGCGWHRQCAFVTELRLKTFDRCSRWLAMWKALRAETVGARQRGVAK